MRKILALALAAAFVPALALADIESAKTKRVEVRILPSIAVSTEVGTTSVTPSLQTGDITLFVPFRIDANTQSVIMQAYATDLFKADQGGVDFQSAHRLIHTGAVSVAIAPSPDPEAGGGMVGANGPALLSYTGNGTNVLAPDGLTWTFYGTNQGTYESGIRGRFSHDVTLDVTWNNSDPELPQGNYSGWVKLYAQIFM